MRAEYSRIAPQVERRLWAPHPARRSARTATVTLSHEPGRTESCVQIGATPAPEAIRYRYSASRRTRSGRLAFGRDHQGAAPRLGR